MPEYHYHETMAWKARGLFGWGRMLKYHPSYTIFNGLRVVPDALKNTYAPLQHVVAHGKEGTHPAIRRFNTRAHRVEIE